MKHDETEDKLLEEGDSEQQVDETPGDAFRKASQIEQIDDSQLPQSIKDLFKK
jgi:hypothetical protein